MLPPTAAPAFTGGGCVCLALYTGTATWYSRRMTTTTIHLTDAMRTTLLVAFVGEADSSDWGDAYMLRGARAIVNARDDFEVDDDLDFGDVDDETTLSDEHFVLLTADYQGVSLR